VQATVRAAVRRTARPTRTTAILPMRQGRRAWPSRPRWATGAA
jgi:hypothetical protein